MLPPSSTSANQDMEDNLAEGQDPAPSFQFVNVICRSKNEKDVKRRIRSHAMKAVRRRQRTSRGPSQSTQATPLTKCRGKPHLSSQGAIAGINSILEEQSRTRTSIPSPISILDQGRANPFQRWPVDHVGPEVYSLIDYCK